MIFALLPLLLFVASEQAMRMTSRGTRIEISSGSFGTIFMRTFVWRSTPPCWPCWSRLTLGVGRTVQYLRMQHPHAQFCVAQHSYLVAMHEQFGSYIKGVDTRHTDRLVTEEQSEDLRRYNVLVVLGVKGVGGWWCVQGRW